MEKLTSKKLSLILRHRPEVANITLDECGWADVNQLLKNTNTTFCQLERIVSDNDKKRFTFNEDFKKIRANQGHSIKVELNLNEVEPPHFLFHGTAERFKDSILKEGLTKQSRHCVHLSGDKKSIVYDGNAGRYFTENYKSSG